MLISIMRTFKKKFKILKNSTSRKIKKIVKKFKIWWQKKTHKKYALFIWMFDAIYLVKIIKSHLSVGIRVMCVKLYFMFVKGKYLHKFLYDCYCAFASSYFLFASQKKRDNQDKSTVFISWLEYGCRFAIFSFSSTYVSVEHALFHISLSVGISIHLAATYSYELSHLNLTFKIFIFNVTSWTRLNFVIVCFFSLSFFNLEKDRE